MLVLLLALGSVGVGAYASFMEPGAGLYKDAGFMDALDYDFLLNVPSIREAEYTQHSSLQHNSGHKYLGGGGDWEGKLEKEIKTDPVLPAYCNPPNPCPVGYNHGEDGCTETFENTAAFSRDFQAAQDCMCDTEHMFDCPALKEQNNELDLTQTTDLLLRNLGLAEGMNPYLEGERLPIAAKKGQYVAAA